MKIVMKIAEPIVKKVQDNTEALGMLEQQISKSKNNKVKDIIMNFPIVYIHNWKKQR